MLDLGSEAWRHPVVDGIVRPGGHPDQRPPLGGPTSAVVDVPGDDGAAHVCLRLLDGDEPRPTGERRDERVLDQVLRLGLRAGQEHAVRHEARVALQRHPLEHRLPAAHGTSSAICRHDNEGG